MDTVRDMLTEIMTAPAQIVAVLAALLFTIHSVRIVVRHQLGKAITRREWAILAVSVSPLLVVVIFCWPVLVQDADPPASTPSTVEGQ